MCWQSEHFAAHMTRDTVSWKSMTQYLLTTFATLPKRFYSNAPALFVDFHSRFYRLVEFLALCARGAHIVHMSYACRVHVMLMWWAYDVHVVCMYCTCTVHVVCVCRECVDSCLLRCSRTSWRGSLTWPPRGMGWDARTPWRARESTATSSASTSCLSTWG